MLFTLAKWLVAFILIVHFEVLVSSVILYVCLYLQQIYGSSSVTVDLSKSWVLSSSEEQTQSLPQLVVPDLISNATTVIFSATSTCPSCPVVKKVAPTRQPIATSNNTLMLPCPSLYCDYSRVTSKSQKHMQYMCIHAECVTVLYCTVLYCTVLYCTVLYCAVLYCTVLYCTVLYCAALYCTVLYCTVLYCTVLYCTVLHCTVLYCTVLHCTVLYCTVLYCAALYCTVLYCTVLYCTVLHCTVLYCTVLYCTVLCCTVLYCTVLYCTAW